MALGGFVPDASSSHTFCGRVFDRVASSRSIARRATSPAGFLNSRRIERAAAPARHRHILHEQILRAVAIGWPRRHACRPVTRRAYRSALARGERGRATACQIDEPQTRLGRRRRSHQHSARAIRRDRNRLVVCRGEVERAGRRAGRVVPRRHGVRAMAPNSSPVIPMRTPRPTSRRSTTSPDRGCSTAHPRESRDRR